MNILKDYSKEIGMSECISLQQLIDSHRYLRSLNQDTTEGLHEYVAKCRESYDKMIRENMQARDMLTWTRLCR